MSNVTSSVQNPTSSVYFVQAPTNQWLINVPTTCWIRSNDPFLIWSLFEFRLGTGRYGTEPLIPGGVLKHELSCNDLKTGVCLENQLLNTVGVFLLVATIVQLVQLWIIFPVEAKSKCDGQRGSLGGAATIRRFITACWCFSKLPSEADHHLFCLFSVATNIIRLYWNPRGACR